MKGYSFGSSPRKEGTGLYDAIIMCQRTLSKSRNLIMEDKITIVVADTSTELIPSSWRGLSM